MNIHTYKCYFFKVRNRSKNRKIIKLIAPWSTYHLSKLVCWVWYQSAHRYGTHEHLGVYTPINVFFKSKIGIKMGRKTKTDYSINYLPPKLTYIQNLVTIDCNFCLHKHSGADREQRTESIEQRTDEVFYCSLLLLGVWNVPQKNSARLKNKINFYPTAICVLRDFRHIKT